MEISHLVFAVHGIGATSDTGGRSVVDHGECVSLLLKHASINEGAGNFFLYLLKAMQTAPWGVQPKTWKAQNVHACAPLTKDISFLFAI